MENCLNCGTFLKDIDAERLFGVCMECQNKGVDTDGGVVRKEELVRTKPKRRYETLGFKPAESFPESGQKIDTF